MQFQSLKENKETIYLYIRDKSKGTSSRSSFFFMNHNMMYQGVKSAINCVCAFFAQKDYNLYYVAIRLDTPNTENEIKWCEHAILWEFEGVRGLRELHSNGAIRLHQ